MDVMLTDVLVIERGSSLLADAAVDATVLVVDDPTDFGDSADDIGVVELNGLRYSYAGVEKDTGTITLTSPLTVAASAGDPVGLVAGNQVAIDWIALCDAGEGGPPEASIPFPFRSSLPEGHYDPPVPVTITDSPTPELLKVDGRAPEIAQEFVYIPMIRLDVESNITIPNNVWTNPAFWWVREVRDEDGKYFYYDGISTYRMQIFRPGTYLVMATVAFATNSSGFRGVRFRRQAAFSADAPAITEVVQAAVSGQRTTIQISRAVACGAGDVVWVEVSQDSGADLAIQGVPGGSQTSWSFVRLG